MSEYVKTVVLENGVEVAEPYVVREVQVTKLMRIPLYVAGKLKSDEELAALGLTVKRYTQAELDAEECAKLYAANPDLAKRVREYKGYLDELGMLDYGATTDMIEEAIAISTTIEDKEQYVLRIKTAFDNIVLNLQAINSDYTSFTAWSKMPALIANLPSSAEAAEGMPAETESEELATAEPSEAGSDKSDESDKSEAEGAE